MFNSSTTTPPTSPTSTPPSPLTDVNLNDNNENTQLSVFKISNQTITRRFTMQVEKPTWLELELKVREAFSIPSSVSPGLTYTDEEGDVITISSQLELEDYYKQFKRYDLSENYKFGLVIFTPIRDYVDDSQDNNNYSSPDYEEQEVRSICPTQ
ncbi:6947_t:CDS:1 [Funneliformis mosseae]|uniref:6947_t:CDS:1 n=2 Tax=Funneliformis TaxID=1117308 RepID=A0A9N9G2C0_FUNMO|nr:6947_t:CDS:1 [Funneliformis mosseae]